MDKREAWCKTCRLTIKNSQVVYQVIEEYNLILKEGCRYVFACGMLELFINLRKSIFAPVSKRNMEIDVALTLIRNTPREQQIYVSIIGISSHSHRRRAQAKKEAKSNVRTRYLDNTWKARIQAE